MISTKNCKVNATQLRIGTKVEMEHTSNPLVARRIAKQHLCEFKDKPYYSYLSKMEKRLSKK